MILFIYTHNKKEISFPNFYSNESRTDNARDNDY